MDTSTGAQGGWSWTTHNSGFSICGLDYPISLCSPMPWASAAATPGGSVGRNNAAITSVVAPAGTSIVAAWYTLDSTLTHDQSFTVRVKTATGSQSVKSGTTVYDAPAGPAQASYSVPAGSYSKVGVVLQASQTVPAGTVTATGDDGFLLDRATIVLHDDSAPALSQNSLGASPVGDGQWHDGIVCVPLLATDVGS